MNNIYLFQPQTLTQENGKPVAWLPYGSARLWGYVSNFSNITDNFTLKKLFFLRLPVDEVISKLDNPAICGFTAYMWNYNYCLTLAKKIKQEFPNCQIVFGGPHITSTTIDEFDFIDTVIEGEGEVLFKEYLEELLENNHKRHYNKQRVRDLNILTSPFLLGIFDDLIAEYPEYRFSSVMETSRGCPFACTFCDWGSATNSKVFLFDMELIKNEINWFKMHTEVTHIILADANFGIFKERDLEVAKILNSLLDNNHPRKITANFTKVYNDYLIDIYQLLGENNSISIGLQSYDKEVLKAIKRKNIPDALIKKLLQNSKETDLSVKQEYILGLPLESKESWYEGMTYDLSSGDHRTIVVYPCSILPNTELESKESREKYGIKTTWTNDLTNVGSNKKDGIPEYTEVIQSTNTMSYEDLVDCYLFSIIIMHTHCTGYSRIPFLIANKHFKVKNLNFYLALESALYKDQVFGDHLAYLRSLICEMYETGSTTDPQFANEGRVDYLSYTFFYKNKNRLSNIIADVFQTMTNCRDDYLEQINKIQKVFIFDLSHQTEQEVILDFDLDTLAYDPVKYTVKTKLSKKQFLVDFNGSGNLQKLHFNNKLINNFEKASNPIKSNPITTIPIVFV